MIQKSIIGIAGALALGVILTGCGRQEQPEPPPPDAVEQAPDVPLLVVPDDN